MRYNIKLYWNRDNYTTYLSVRFKVDGHWVWIHSDTGHSTAVPITQVNRIEIDRIEENYKGT